MSIKLGRKSEPFDFHKGLKKDNLYLLLKKQATWNKSQISNPKVKILS